MPLKCLKCPRHLISQCHTVSFPLAIIRQPVPPGHFLLAICLDLLLCAGIPAEGVLAWVGEVLDLLDFLWRSTGRRPRKEHMQAVRVNVQPCVGQRIGAIGIHFPECRAQWRKIRALPTLAVYTPLIWRAQRAGRPVATDFVKVMFRIGGQNRQPLCLSGGCAQNHAAIGMQAPIAPGFIDKRRHALPAQRLHKIRDGWIDAFPIACIAATWFQGQRAGIHPALCGQEVRSAMLP